MATINYKVAGFSPNVKSDSGVIQRNDFRRDGAYSKDGVTPSRFSYNFDGVDDYATLATRAINVDSDIDIEFYAPSDVSLTGSIKTILSQNVSIASAEFILFVSNTTGNLAVTIGGTTVAVGNSGEFSASQKLRLLITGSTRTLFRSDGSIIRTGSITRGASREPAALTVIGARTNATIGSYNSFFIGFQRDIKINGVLWQMATRNSATQVSTPTGNTMTLVNTADSRWQEIIE